MAMILRAEQIEKFDEYSRKGFEERLARHVRMRYADVRVSMPAGVFPVSELPAECLAAMVRQSIEKARQYGISWESATASFTALMFVVGPNFDEHPAIRRELQDPDVPDNSKIDHLSLVISEATWRDAKQAQGQKAWGVPCPALESSRREHGHA